jgi:hypothetical protein
MLNSAMFLFRSYSVKNNRKSVLWRMAQAIILRLPRLSLGLKDSRYALVGGKAGSDWAGVFP